MAPSAILDSSPGSSVLSRNRARDDTGSHHPRRMRPRSRSDNSRRQVQQSFRQPSTRPPWELNSIRMLAPRTAPDDHAARLGLAGRPPSRSSSAESLLLSIFGCDPAGLPPARRAAGVCVSVAGVRRKVAWGARPGLAQRQAPTQICHPQDPKRRRPGSPRARHVGGGRQTVDEASSNCGAVDGDLPGRGGIGQRTAVYVGPLSRRGRAPHRTSAGQIRLDRLTAAHIAAFYRDRLTAGSVRRLHANLRRALNIALRWQLIHTNPVALVDPPSKPHSEVKPCSLDEARAFLKAVRGRRLEARRAVGIALGL